MDSGEEQYTDQPHIPQEEAEGLGGIAITNPDQEMQQHDNGQEQPVENHDMAEAMAYEEEPIRQIIENVRASNIPDKESRIKELEEKGKDLSRAAGERYLAAEAKYAQVRDEITGSLFWALENNSSSPAKIFSSRRESRDSDRYIVHTNSESPAVLLSAEDADRLYSEAYALLGADKPVGNPFDNFRITADTFPLPSPTASIRSNISGVKAFEQLTLQRTERDSEYFRSVIGTRALYVGRNQVDAT